MGANVELSVHSYKLESQFWVIGVFNRVIRECLGVANFQSGGGNLYTKLNILVALSLSVVRETLPGEIESYYVLEGNKHSVMNQIL